MRRLCGIMMALLVASPALFADEDASAGLVRTFPVEKAFTFEVGKNVLHDTYLTPLRYDGISFGIAYQQRQAMRFDPSRWNMRLTGRVNFAPTENPSRTATIYNLGAHFDWAMTRVWNFPDLPSIFSFGVGGGTSLNLGCLYSTRNGNNPVSAKASWTIDFAGVAEWKWREPGRVPITVRYQPTIPLTGAFFSPEYGQLYYEIYMGDNRNLAHFAHPGNYFAIENLVTADFRFGTTSVRIGYRGNFLSTRINNITSREVTNAIVIGVSGCWIPVRY